MWQTNFGKIDNNYTINIDYSKQAVPWVFVKRRGDFFYQAALWRYLRGVVPTWSLKNWIMADGVLKFSSSEICSMVLSVVFSWIFISMMMALLIHARMDLPVMRLMAVVRYLGVRAILLA